MKLHSKALAFAASLALAGTFAFSAPATAFAGANSNTAVAGASAALASAVASADAEVAALDNAKAEASVKKALAATETEAADTKAADTTAADAEAKAQAEAQAQAEADKAAAETKAAVEQAIAEEEYKKNLGEASQDEAKKDEESDGNVEGESVEGISWSGSKASEVVNYATEFVGNPYVWGGTSLTHGTDCSGFTMSVYKHFGKNIPHSSSAQRSVGKAVSVKDMKPGDLICYDGHVALYCGNDTIVHASNPSTGIKFGNVYYRQILAVRRLM